VCKHASNRNTDTNDRFNSKSGWLSFTKAIDNSTIEKPDNRFGMSRIEICNITSKFEFTPLVSIKMLPCLKLDKLIVYL
jgi:peptide methionine sulfoxide reductase MsrB